VTLLTSEVFSRNGAMAGVERFTVSSKDKCTHVEVE
jgi:hypothetical protein